MYVSTVAKKSTNKAMEALAISNSKLRYVLIKIKSFKEVLVLAYSKKTRTVFSRKNYQRFRECRFAVDHYIFVDR